MTETTRLKLPLLAAAQAQKHVTINEALTLLDLLTGVIPALSRAHTAPPGGDSDGDVYLLAGAGTGAWAGYDADDVAMMIDGGWRRALPAAGMIASLADEGGKLVYWTGAAWAEVNPAAGGGTFTGLLTVNGQIRFPATQNPSADANTFDDYEEGTYTPTVSAPSGTFTSVSATGAYTKIGRLVSFAAAISIVTNGTASGYVRCSLPFYAATTIWGAGSIGGANTMVSAFNPSGSVVAILKYDGTYPGGNGVSIYVGGNYSV